LFVSEQLIFFVFLFSLLCGKMLHTADALLRGIRKLSNASAVTVGSHDSNNNGTNNGNDASNSNNNVSMYPAATHQHHQHQQHQPHQPHQQQQFGDPETVSRLFEAVRENDVALCTELLTATPELVHATDWGGTAAIHIACFLRHYSIAEMLITMGANIFMKDRSLKEARHYIKDAHMKQTLEEMCSNKTKGIDPVKPFTPEEMKFKQLRDEIFLGGLEQVTLLIKENPILINFQDRRGNTALHFACVGNQFDIAELLLYAGWNYKICNNLHEAPVNLIADYNTRQRIGKIAFDLSPEGIVAAEEERVRQELLSEQRTRECMDREDKRSALFAAEEIKYMAFELKNMRQEEKDMQTFFKKLRLMQMSVRKDLARECVQAECVATAFNNVLEYRIANYQAEKEAARQAEIRARKSAKAKKVKRLRALLQDADPLLAHPGDDDAASDTNSVNTWSEEDLDEERVLRLLLEKEQKKERDRLEAIRKKEEAAERLRQDQLQRARREAERVARLEWNQLQSDLRKEAKLEFERTKPHRVEKLRRQRRAMTAIK
jgi:ankyrin repeat protein